jgi:hypothetical protein
VGDLPAHREMRIRLWFSLGVACICLLALCLGKVECQSVLFGGIVARTVVELWLLAVRVPDLVEFSHSRR